MSQFQPLPGVAYRIQNVKSGNYLEFDSKNSAVVRPRHDDALAQQWKFVRTAKNTYKIVNAASDADNSHLALGLDPVFVGLVAATDEEETSVSWKVNVSSDRGHCSIIAQNQASSKDHLEADSDNLIQIATDSNQDNQKWRIVLGLPSGFSGTNFRLQNTDTTTAVTLHDNFLKMGPVENSLDQAWELIQVGGGDYQIKKMGGGGYLSWSRSPVDVYRTVITTEPARWTILNYEQRDYGIFPKIPNVNLALTGRSNVPLDAPSQNHLGQRWLIDTFTPDTKPIPQTITPPRRVPAIPGGKYSITSVGTGYTAYANSTDDNTPIVALASAAPLGFLFVYPNPTSAFFFISHDGKLPIAPGSAGSPLKLSAGANGPVHTLWYLVEEPGTAEYYICSDIAGKRLAWGKSVKSQLSRDHEVYTMEEWVKGDRNQRWELTPKS